MRKDRGEAHTQPLGELDPKLVDAVNQLVWFIADEFVDATYEHIWLAQMLPEREETKVRAARGARS
jgi:hypothetical protein